MNSPPLSVHAKQSWYVLVSCHSLRNFLKLHIIRVSSQNLKMVHTKKSQKVPEYLVWRSFEMTNIDHISVEKAMLIMQRRIYTVDAKKQTYILK